MTTKRHLYVSFDNGDVFRVPISVVAHSYADYKVPDWRDSIPRLMDHNKITCTIMDDEEFLLGWAYNNVNWDDISFHAVRVDKPTSYDYNEGYMSAKLEIK